MKKLFTSFAFICLFALGAFAQGNFTLSGIVTNGTSASVVNHQVCIYTDSMQTTFAYYNCVNTDNQGYFSVVIPGGAMAGPNIVFYVSTLSCNTYLQQQVQNNQGTTSSATVSFVICGGGTGTTCNTTMYAIPDSTANPSNYFFAAYTTENGTSANVATYSWDFGDGTTSTLPYPQHIYAVPGTYTACLTAVTVNGCSSTACTTVSIAAPSSCSAAFGYQSTGAGSNTYFNANFGANYNYSWSFGDGTSGSGQYPIHSYATSGSYTVCLLVYDAVANCSDTVCNMIYVQPAQTSFYIGGQVSLPGMGFLTPADYATVYLVRHDSLYLNLIDSTSVDSMGHYWFSQVAAGAYLVKAALTSNSAYYAGYMPTYHNSSLFWTTAVDVLVLNSNVTNANITMIVGNNPGGPGFIGGSVLQGANRMASPGDPISGITILLLDNNNNAVAHTATDASGHYSFSSIAYGTYKVYIDVAGKTTVPSIVTINAANPTVTNLDIEVNSGSILFVRNVVVSEKVAFGIYPNPAKDFLTISVDLKDAANLNLVIENNLGQTVKNNSYKLNSGINNITESLVNLPKGVYSVTISDSDSRTSTRFVKAE